MQTTAETLCPLSPQDFDPFFSFLVSFATQLTSIRIPPRSLALCVLFFSHDVLLLVPKHEQQTLIDCPRNRARSRFSCDPQDGPGKKALETSFLWIVFFVLWGEGNVRPVIRERISSGPREKREGRLLKEIDLRSI